MTLNVIIDLGPVLTKLGGSIVAVLSDFTDKLDAMTASIATIKQEITDLKAQLASGGLTAAEEQTVLDKITALQTAITDAASA